MHLAFRALKEHGRILVSDLRYGVRVLIAAPAFTTIALVVIALGIGATASIFSLVNAVLLRSLPYGHPEKLVYLWSPNVNFKGAPQELGPNVPDFYDWQRLSHSFSSMTMLREAGLSMVDRGSSERVEAAFVAGNFFQTMQARPVLGRGIDGNDDQPGRQRVAVISDRLWHSRFAADPHIADRQIQLGRATYSVIGVMPKDFGYPFDGDIPFAGSGFKQTDIWLPLAYTADQKSNRTNSAAIDAAIGRLRDGISAGAAETELRSIEGPLNALYPDMWKGWTVLVRPLVESILGPVEKMLWLLLGAVGLVLLIAISNVANLLLARATVRAHELGIRSALGAERSRLVRQLLTESLMLSCIGGALGIALAYAAVHLLSKLNPGNIPRFDSASVDTRVLLVAVILSLGAGLLSGFIPAISASRAGINDLLKRGAGRVAGSSNHGRFTMIVMEVALSVVLLAGSGLLIRSYLRVQAVDPGFSPATLTFRLNLDGRYNQPEVRVAFYKTFLAKLQGLRGVRYAGASDDTPLSNHESLSFADIRGFGVSREMLETRSVTPDYLKALGAPLLRGRDFDLRDVNSKRPVVMVNQKFAETFFHGRDPLGGQVRLGGIGDFSGRPWLTVVGIVANIRHNSMEEASQPQIFQPTDNSYNFAIQCTAAVPQVIQQARAALRAQDPVLTLEDIHTMNERIDQSNARRTFQTTLLTGFAAIAVALALIGLYGLMSYAVKQRTAEIGLRLAIGSPRGRVLRLILSQGLRLTAVGLLLGLAAAFAVTRLVGGWLFGVNPMDPITFIAVPLFILAVAFCACVVPAYNATRIDPVQALRQE